MFTYEAILCWTKAYAEQHELIYKTTTGPENTEGSAS